MSAQFVRRDAPRSEPTLWGIVCSPWTARAAFALDFARVRYRFRVYVPLWSEPRMRRLTGSNKPSAPIFAHGRDVVMGSDHIARWAAEQGEAPRPLFPDGQAEPLAHWLAQSEILLSAGRQLLLPRVRGNKQVATEYVPAFVPGPLRPLFREATQLAAKHIQNKYQVPPYDEAALHENVRGVLAPLAEHLAKQPTRHTLLESFSFADLTLCTALGALSPTDLEPTTRAVGPAIRAAWTHELFVREFPSVFAYRDRIYREFRGA